MQRLLKGLSHELSGLDEVHSDMPLKSVADLMRRFAIENSPQVVLVTTSKDRRPYLLIEMPLSEIKTFLEEEGFILKHVDHLSDIVFQIKGADGRDIGRVGQTHREGSSEIIIAFSPNRIKGRQAISDAGLVMAWIKKLVENSNDALDKQPSQASSINTTDEPIATHLLWPGFEVMMFLLLAKWLMAGWVLAWVGVGLVAGVALVGLLSSAFFKDNLQQALEDLPQGAFYYPATGNLYGQEFFAERFILSPLPYEKINVIVFLDILFGFPRIPQRTPPQLVTDNRMVNFDYYKIRYGIKVVSTPREGVAEITFEDGRKYTLYTIKGFGLYA
jgi:hypothetical protein